MSADLCIHIFEGITEKDLAAFFANSMGSKYFDLSKKSCDDETFDKIGGTDQIIVGEVSWLKAAIIGSDAFVPDPIAKITEIIGEDLPVIDDELIGKIDAAMRLPNTTRYFLRSGKSVVEWLKARKEKRVFTVSW